MGVVDFLYSKLILIAFIIIYIIGWFDYYKNISSKSGILKNGLLFINICLIIMFSSIIMQFYILEQRKESTVESVNNNNNNDH
jgi:TRAP-type C4-dicarboxylate transport system permease small subunit